MGLLSIIGGSPYTCGFKRPRNALHSGSVVHFYWGPWNVAFLGLVLAQFWVLFAPGGHKFAQVGQDTCIGGSSVQCHKISDKMNCSKSDIFFLILFLNLFGILALRYYSTRSKLDQILPKLSQNLPKLNHHLPKSYQNLPQWTLACPSPKINQLSA